MGTAIRQQFPDMINQLILSANQYDFFQAVAIIEKQTSGLSDIRFRPHKQISFPGSAVKSIARGPDNTLTMRLAFMGLYGVDTPLPHYFIDHTTSDDDRAQSMRAFLDIFAHRLYTLLYLAWKQYHPITQLNRSDSPYLRYIHALSGNTLKPTDTTAYAFSGILGARIHNRAGLTGMLTALLSGIDVSVQPFAPRWQRVDVPATHYLGDNTLLGHRVLNVSQHIVIRMGPLCWQQCRALLPHQKKAKELCDLIARYVGPWIDFDLVLIAHPPNTRCLTLQQPLRLGWGFFLGQASSFDIRYHGRDPLAFFAPRR